jgi:hypothetical protein
MIVFLNQQINNIISFKYWKIGLALISPIIALFLSFPNLENLENYYVPMLEFAENPLKPHFFPAESTYSKLTFRLLPIFFIKLLNLNFFTIIIWQYVIGIFLIYNFSKVIHKISKSELIAFLSTLSIIFIYIGKLSFINFKPNFDSLALALFCIYFINDSKILKFILLFLVCWIDERAIVSSFFLILYDLFFNSTKGIKSKFSISILLIIPSILYILIRILLIKKFGLISSTGGVSLKILALNLNLLPLSIWQSFEGNWVVIGFCFYNIYKTKSKKLILFILLLIIMFIGIVVASNLVYDVSRSLVYLFPMLIICYKLLHKISNQSTILKITKYSCLISILYPSYIVGGPKIEWMKPYILNLIFQFFTNS